MKILSSVKRLKLPDYLNSNSERSGREETTVFYLLQMNPSRPAFFFSHFPLGVLVPAELELGIPQGTEPYGGNAGSGVKMH